MFSVTHAVRCFGNRGEREADAQIRPDEIKACLLDFIPKSLWIRFAHVPILTETNSGTGPQDESHDTGLASATALWSKPLRFAAKRMRRVRQSITNGPHQRTWQEWLLE